MAVARGMTSRLEERSWENRGRDKQAGCLVVVGEAFEGQVAAAATFFLPAADMVCSWMGGC